MSGWGQAHKPNQATITETLATSLGDMQDSRDAWRDLAVALIDHWTPRDDSLWDSGESLRRIIDARDTLDKLGEPVDAVERNIREAKSYDPPELVIEYARVSAWSVTRGGEYEGEIYKFSDGTEYTGALWGER